MLAELILAQLQAWNSGDLNKMMTYYHDDVKVYTSGVKDPILTSKQNIITHAKPEFDAGTFPRIVVIGIKEDAPYVLTIEEKRPVGKEPSRGLFTYLVEDKKVKTLWHEKVPITKDKITDDDLVKAKSCNSSLAGKGQ